MGGLDESEGAQGCDECGVDCECKKKHLVDRVRPGTTCAPRMIGRHSSLVIGRGGDDHPDKGNLESWCASCKFVVTLRTMRRYLTLQLASSSSSSLLLLLPLACEWTSERVLVCVGASARAGSIAKQCEQAGGCTRCACVRECAHSIDGSCR